METEIERTYHPNGKLQSEQPHVDGVRHGLTKYWRRNGQLESEHPYVDGKPHGVWKWWRPNGDIVEFWLWNQDELVAKFFPRNETQKWKLK
jgi:antitoxin component YwqK of YwqJK toxin-antitoxin module